MQTHIIIPARFGSSRLPGKPLLDLGGKPVIAHVIEQAKAHFDNVYVATDDTRIFDCAESYGAVAVMTSEDHASGTDRLAEVAMTLNLPDEDIVLNLQGDEPLMPPVLLKQLEALLLAKPDSEMATLMHEIHTVEELLNPNVVKVAVGENKRALYFSRAPIPYPRDEFAKDKSVMPDGNYFRHIGLYGYRVGSLKAISALAESPLECLEKLEQLRPLSNGIEILIDVSEVMPPHGVDTLADLEALRKHFE
ncbi:3-deoxy-manno-octulosonate cytidylyltransferase [Vibrio cholerae]|uniref:3-deoxy-manno-octulosonate cytidylyltransferase n=1 Tax=Vibrio cholerae TaxID=666 RepID=UPI000BA93A6D|nr:3-deoxy-manno-octulosonate cytidylyltransferase [Vibrio cholerae]EGQ8390575.1 3-deoxy-manno-octulosonate cytidylyltransferase [Vibrio cholerae]EGR0773779.1 3-deoxy-manno-octulosonate cytidylyltransferase [Vibrio cholerae]EGR0778453.1 3-deoxy-manno-octulosonate cytidylyltransferase [Vibrio cholerae]EGR0782143.1 3-deoxy-manno-octulosonate cytidylyltransferase [Vibrio cholerae]EGR0794222.1 3-deoxy-manno-octulosonate cytidylyltransferase [Vibrio cholerae]